MISFADPYLFDVPLKSEIDSGTWYLRVTGTGMVPVTRSLMILLSYQYQ
jgi:hypothetical protein